MSIQGDSACKEILPRSQWAVLKFPRFLDELMTAKWKTAQIEVEKKAEAKLIVGAQARMEASPYIVAAKKSKKLEENV